MSETTDQLRAAAERLQRCPDDCEGSGCRNYCCSWPGRCQEDALTDRLGRLVARIAVLESLVSFLHGAPMPGEPVPTMDDMVRYFGGLSGIDVTAALGEQLPLTLDAARAMLPAGWELAQVGDRYLLEHTAAETDEHVSLPLDITVGEFVALLRGLRAN